jgi:ribA/ribD-fused uncharacterized protein
METLISASIRADITKMVAIAATDPKAELEVKVLTGQLRTKDEVDRLTATIEDLTAGGFTEEHRATFTYSGDGLRVAVTTPETIYKLCTTGSFRGLPLTVERKRKYFDVPESGDKSIPTDTLDIPDLKLRVSLRHEEPLRKDFSGSPMDPKSHVRILHRRSWKTSDGLLRIDFSIVKSKTKLTKTLPEIVRLPPTYELELEVINKQAPAAAVVKSILTHTEALVASFQQSPFLLTESDMHGYRMEFESMKTRFLNPVTLVRRHIVSDRQGTILRGYTVTNKADGERCMLFVARDRRVLRITRKGTIAWTGLTATDDSHLGDIIDGEYLADRNLFCIFDVYVFRTKRVDRLPLMTTDEDIHKDPGKSRLGCAHLFVGDLTKSFVPAFSRTPFRIETKLFLAGDGSAMEQAINRLLDTQFEYPTDGLIFTPRASSVAPVSERKGDTWLSVYKWKPPHQNSIDFLVRFKSAELYDPALDKQVVKGTVYVSRNPGSDILFPCETLTGEYIPPQIPADLPQQAGRAPSPFQPSAPRSPEASDVYIPVNARGIPVDAEGQKVEDNTIIECSRDIRTARWTVLRTRYDKTYQYRVLNQPQFGNDIYTAESIWTNIHNPVTEEMIRSIVSSPADDTYEDDLYYRDALESRDRVMTDIVGFHNKVKEQLYSAYVTAGNTLLELGVGRGNDMHKWKRTKPSKVVGIDLSESNINAPRQGACVRYLRSKAETPRDVFPPALFIVADMTQPLRDQENRYLKMLTNQEPAPTPYLEKFMGLSEFDAISCQFAIHYACESEASFRTFVGNLTAHGKGTFFGTCMDGKAVYSLLMGTPGYMFRSAAPGGQVWGEIRKDYADGAGWSEDFGSSITVKLESFERPVKEFLVPFEKVTSILAENGYELIRTTLFSDHYSNQKEFTFDADHRAFSFLHRSFAFKRVQAKPKQEDTQAVTVPVVEEKEEPKKVEEKPKTILKKKKVPEGEEPVLITAATDELSNQYEAPMQIDGITFPSVEHYYQWSKAKKFGDAETEGKIMKTTSSKSVKTYGDKVKDFKEDEWKEVQDQVMRTALRAKFLQHPAIKTKLMETGTRPIGEANAREKYWSIGTGADTSKAKIPEKWPGKNRLGELLVELRTELKE